MFHQGQLQGHMKFALMLCYHFLGFCNKGSHFYLQLALQITSLVLAVVGLR
jgi:hypothetical protein